VAEPETSATQRPSSRHHSKDKQRFVVSVIAYDSLPGHQNYAFSRWSAILYDCASLDDAKSACGLLAYESGVELRGDGGR
jgi:hypothetical protein